MRTTTAGVELIKAFEGILDGDPTTVNLDPYLCPAGYWTIGWGHVVRDANGGMMKGSGARGAARAVYPRGITVEEAEVLLRDDLRSFEFEMNRAVRDSGVTSPQFDAMIALSFNIGSAGFLTSSVLRLHRAGKTYSDLSEGEAKAQMVEQNRSPANAADAFLLWNKITDNAGRKVVSNGLVRRRCAERALYLKS